MKTGFNAVKLGGIAYLMPFFFINNPNLIGQGTLLNTLQAFATAVLGCCMLAIIIQGVTFKGNRVPLVSRIIWGLAALSLLDPNGTTDLIGIALFFVALLSTSS
jgi:TRAP-type uncharacterized transport system fused permease subunit